MPQKPSMSRDCGVFESDHFSAAVGHARRTAIAILATILVRFALDIPAGRPADRCAPREATWDAVEKGSPGSPAAE
jgi:hypothetical protein